jgi:hypothetical protein
VEQTVTSQLQSMASRANTGVTPQIVSITVMPLGGISAIEPNAGAPDPNTAFANTIVWVVRAHGTFVGDRVPPGGNPAIGTTGYFMIDDATGDVIGMGMP